MIKQFSLLFLFLLPMVVLGQRVTVPKYTSFADISLRLSDRAQREIQVKVDALHRNQKYFQRKVGLADIYFPVIERTLKEEGVPADYKYLALQESGLIGDTISRSNAVGFWQFKKEAASDFNLRVDNQVDERQHIVEATRGAARYMKRSNSYYKNWLNTLLSYSLGFNGAKAYTSPSEIGSRRIDITERTHPYVLTFLAHKIAYENYIGKAGAPAIVLQEMRVKPGQSLSDIALATNTDAAELAKYNKWLAGNRIPSGKEYVVMVPVRNGELNAFEIAAANTEPQEIAVAEASDEYATGVATADVRQHNSTRSSRYPKSYKSGFENGAVVRQHHTVSPGDTLYQLSRKYNASLEELRQWNNLSNDNIKIGRKLRVVAPQS